jgi:hypothetical protein
MAEKYVCKRRSKIKPNGGLEEEGSDVSNEYV